MTTGRNLNPIPSVAQPRPPAANFRISNRHDREDAHFPAVFRITSGAPRLPQAPPPARTSCHAKFLTATVAQSPIWLTDRFEGTKQFRDRNKNGDSEKTQNFVTWDRRGFAPFPRHGEQVKPTPQILALRESRVTSHESRSFMAPLVGTNHQSLFTNHAPLSGNFLDGGEFGDFDVDLGALAFL